MCPDDEDCGLLHGENVMAWVKTSLLGDLDPQADTLHPSSCSVSSTWAYNLTYSLRHWPHMSWPNYKQG